MTQLAFWLVIGGHVFTALPSYTSNRHAQEGCQSRRLGRRCMRRVYSFSDSQCRLPCLNFHGLSGTAVSRPIVSISRVAFLNCLVSVVFFVIFYGNSVLHRQLLLFFFFFFLRVIPCYPQNLKRKRLPAFLEKEEDQNTHERSLKYINALHSLHGPKQCAGSWQMWRGERETCLTSTEASRPNRDGDEWEQGDRRVKPRNRRQPGRPTLPWTAARITAVSVRHCAATTAPRSCCPNC